MAVYLLSWILMTLAVNDARISVSSARVCAPPFGERPNNNAATKLNNLTDATQSHSPHLWEWRLEAGGRAQKRASNQFQVFPSFRPLAHSLFLAQCKQMICSTARAFTRC